MQLHAIFFLHSSSTDGDPNVIPNVDGVLRGTQSRKELTASSHVAVKLWPCFIWSVALVVQTLTNNYWY